MSIRSDFLGVKLDRLLSRYVPPRGLPPQGQEDEIAALSRAIDRAAPRDGYEAWWDRFEDALCEGLTTRAWPTVGDIAKTAKVARTPGSSRSDGENPQVYAGAVDWWHKHEGRCPWAKEHHAIRMEREGIASKRELWRAGWDVPSAWVDEILGRGRFSVPAVEPRRMPHAEGF